jgi:uncharacterized protein (DUF952 family)
MAAHLHSHSCTVWFFGQLSSAAVKIYLIHEFTKLSDGFFYIRSLITNAMPIIYHVTEKDSWQKALQSGFYEAASLKVEGFIHCSEQHQVAGVLERYYNGKINLVKLTIDTEKLKSDVIYEWSPSTQDTFPHIYGSINVDAVVGVEEIIQ